MKAIVDTKEFKRIMKYMKKFVREDTNELMKYIRFEVKKGEIKFEALDGWRIAREFLKCENDVEFSGYINPISFTFLKQIKAEISLENKIVLISDNVFSVKTVQPNGIWYKTDKYLEGNNVKAKVGINALGLKEVLEGIEKTTIRNQAVIIEMGEPKEPIIIREDKDRRNVRMILPMSFDLERDAKQ